MTQRILTEDNFKCHIKSAQSEWAITDLLFSELSDENVNPGGHAIKSHYYYEDGLFKDCEGLTKEGYACMVRWRALSGKALFPRNSS